jgi:2-keto-3-deoxy-L-fuconate dehydrogenase
MARLSGKTAFVTAAGQGIGRASALAMAREGARVIATDINAEALDSLKAEGLEIRVFNVLDPAAVTAMAAEIGTIDVLFNCAGMVAQSTILECDEDEWARAFNLNVTATYRITRAFLPAMLANGGGSIINMSSIVSSTIAAPNRFSYGATKAAVIGMTKSIAADFITQGIRCNCLCPGTIESPSLHSRMLEVGKGDLEAGKALFVARQPMGKLGTVEEIAALVVYLASDDSSLTTGTAQVIDGGWSNT